MFPETPAASLAVSALLLRIASLTLSACSCSWADLAESPPIAASSAWRTRSSAMSASVTFTVLNRGFSRRAFSTIAWPFTR